MQIPRFFPQVILHEESNSMPQTVGDYVVQRLHQWEVRHVFG
jgi:hypothetical protein